MLRVKETSSVISEHDCKPVFQSCAGDDCCLLTDSYLVSGWLCWRKNEGLMLCCSEEALWDSDTLVACELFSGLGAFLLTGTFLYVALSISHECHASCSSLWSHGKHCLCHPCIMPCYSLYWVLHCLFIGPWGGSHSIKAEPWQGWVPVSGFQDYYPCIHLFFLLQKDPPNSRTEQTGDWFCTFGYWGW